MKTITVIDHHGNNHEIPLELAEIAVKRDESITLTLYPEQILRALGGAIPDPRDRFSDLDEHIAEVLDGATGPLQAGEVATHINEQVGAVIATARSVRDRFGSDGWLKKAGYKNTRGSGYISPAPQERLSELDKLIVQVIADHEPMQGAGIAAVLEKKHGHITTAAGVRQRFRRGRPLRAAGYHRTQAGYMGPDTTENMPPQIQLAI